MAPIRRFTGASDSLISKPKARYAYVTFLVDGSDYWKGAVALAKSLQLVGSRYPLIVAVMKQVPASVRRALAAQGCIIREIEEVTPPEGASSKVLRDYYITQYNKLRFWEFFEYTKLCYLDADTVVLKNRDHLFDVINNPNEIAGVQDCTCEGWKFHHRLHNTPYCQIDGRLPWQHPNGLPEPTPYINAGFFMLMPDRKVSRDLFKKLQEYPATGLAEQDFLNEYFKGRIKLLPLANNLMLCNFWNHPDLVSVETAEVVHYCVPGSKPWRFEPEKPHMDLPAVQELVRKWQKIYETDTTVPLAVKAAAELTMPLAAVAAAQPIAAAAQPLLSRPANIATMERVRVAS